MLINEHQWLGILVRPLNYSLRAAVLHIDTGPGLEIEKSHIIEMESCACVSQNDDGQGGAQVDSLNYEKRFERLTLDDGKVVFPNWASDTPSVLWVLIRAISDTLCRGSSSGYDAARYLDCSIYVNFIFNHMHLFGLFILFRHNKEREYCRWNENNSSETGIWSIPQSDI